ncbi:10172_t:CDS:10 [Funneliformis geosporum]|uniref:6212_t:CDS:1 n=1 Tax=Funneliformis geosporum TaxID=1117311 RepID=A0A9W4SH89_9GLOM|nr:10172_t:CDS:10 [Funneliformis geosporum]CAI2169020.1 6212_t:CDS:10 [Funneliformis geosporum]
MAESAEIASMKMKRLVDEASQVKYIPGGALKIYFRSANTLLRQSKLYMKENDLMNAYKFYMRYATLALEKLPSHPEYNKPEHKAGRIELVKNTKEVLNEITRLKPKLEERFRRTAEKEIAEHEARLQSTQKPESMPRPSQFQTQQTFVPYEHWNLVEQLKDLPSQPSSNFTHEEQTCRSVEYPGISMRNQSDGYIYPSMGMPIIKIPTSSTSVISSPALPPKVKYEPPRLPPKPNEYMASFNIPNVEPIFESEPEFAAFTEGGEGLRKVCLPRNIYEIFIRIAASNTLKNLETCGVLFGNLAKNVFSITTLIIPKQTATSDTCTMTNEEELIEYAEEKGLMLQGWIHTHPSQTCFMSSMDLHTHSSYQVISPEAIAIVCAPRHEPNFGIFRLTNPPGLQTVLQCTQRGFHPHNSNLPIDKVC